jgi:flagellar hook-associated protein 3 FlgL
MTISTVTFQSDALAQMEALETAMAQTQSQLSSGSKLQSASDDPSGMAQVNQLNAEISASNQYVTNQNSATANLQLEEQAMSDATNTLQNARDLAVQANNPALSASQRQDIAAQLQQDLQNLVSIANRQDANGNYLFSGTASSTTPFSQSGAGTVSYSGSNQVSQVQISADQRISSGDTGAAVFMNIPAGNGTFTVTAGAANTGTASVGTTTVTNPSAWVPDTYTINFSSPSQYVVTNSAGTQVASGTYTDGDSISFNGVEVDLSGTPNATDTFTVTPAGTSSVFSTLNGLINTLNSTTLNNAQIASQIGNSLQQIDGAVTNLSNVSASAGARLNAITSAQSTEQTNQTTLQTQVSNLSDVDYAAAITQLSTEELSLQAAQESYASIAKMSLFNYLQG